MFRDELQKLNASTSVMEWVGNKNFHAAWNECERADWLLWMVTRKLHEEGWPTRQEIVLATCSCVRKFALPLVPASDKRPRLAVKMAEQWAQGKISTEEVKVTWINTYIDTGMAQQWIHGYTCLNKVRTARKTNQPTAEVAAWGETFKPNAEVAAWRREAIAWRIEIEAAAWEAIWAARATIQATLTVYAVIAAVESTANAVWARSGDTAKVTAHKEMCALIRTILKVPEEFY